MASDGITVNLEGVDQLKRALSAVAKQIRTKAVRGALREGGKVIQNAARANAPVLKTPRANRKPGTIKRNIIVRASKFARRNKDEGVYISVRPLKGARAKKLGAAGAENPNDPFYWWFVEFGTKARTHKPSKRKAMKIGDGFAMSARHPGNTGQKFMTRAAGSHGQAAIQRFMQSVVPQIEKFNRSAPRGR
jgi:HK97 gp10 family phage protein